MFIVELKVTRARSAAMAGYATRISAAGASALVPTHTMRRD